MSAILSQLQQTNMLKGPAVDGALMGLEETLDRALKLVRECQEGHIVRRFFTAGDMSKELRRVHDDISLKMMLELFAVNVQATTVLKNIQSAVAHPLSTQPQVRTIQLLITCIWQHHISIEYLLYKRDCVPCASCQISTLVGIISAYDPDFFFTLNRYKPFLEDQDTCLSNGCHTLSYQIFVHTSFNLTS
jgi:hypothetical protein